MVTPKPMFAVATGSVTVPRLADEVGKTRFLGRYMMPRATAAIVGRYQRATRPSLGTVVAGAERWAVAIGWMESRLVLREEEEEEVKRR